MFYSYEILNGVNAAENDQEPAMSFYQNSVIDTHEKKSTNRWNRVCEISQQYLCLVNVFVGILLPYFNKIRLVHEAPVHNDNNWLGE